MTPKPWIFDIDGFARAISAKREVEDLGLRDVARQCGISVSTINRIEHRKMPELYNAVRLCQWLGVTVDAFVVRPRK